MSRCRLVLAIVVISGCGSKDSDGKGESCEAPTQYWDDVDGDGFGNPMTFASSCSPPAGSADNDRDCDDDLASVNPGATDDCNGIDDDCDGHPDSNGAVWYIDQDHDGYGGTGGSTTACEQPDGYVDNNGDCDDNNAAVNPDAIELCNFLDDNCLNGIDEDFDADADGYYAAGCGGGDDCDDADPSTHPDGFDTCGDGVDNDCEGGDSLCGSFGGEILLGDADAKIYSVGGNEELGRLMDVGDVNGDGEVDVFAAAEYLTNQGGGYILYGPLDGEHVATDVGYVLDAPPGASYCGRSISVGDIDGDGYDDVGLGAPYSAEVFVQFGPIDEDIDLSDASLHANGHGVSLFGHGHDLADMNDDGQDDLIVGSYTDSSGAPSAGTIFIQYGPLGEGETDPPGDYDVALFGFSPNLYAGRIVRAGGDFNGDGAQDMMMQAFGYSGGAPSAGAAFVEFGPVDEDVDLEDVDAILAGEAANSWSGHSLGQGDIDGDGLDDAAVGAPYASEGVSSSGSGYVMFSPLAGVMNLGAADIIVRGVTSNAMTGNSVALGDTNNDGFADLLVGSPGDNVAGMHSGGAYYFYGPFDGTVTGSDADAKFIGENSGDQGGLGVLFADLDHNGAADLLISSPYDATSGPQGGAVYTIYGD